MTAWRAGRARVTGSASRSAGARRCGAGAWVPDGGGSWAAWGTFFGVEAAEAGRLMEGVLRLYRVAMPSLRMNLLTLPGGRPWPRLERGIEPQLAAGAWLACLS